MCVCVCVLSVMADEWSAQCRGHLRDNTIHTKDSHVHSKQVNMIRMIMMAKWYSGNHRGLKFPGICLAREENPERTSLRKFIPTGDRTRARCVKGAHASVCSTAVGSKNKLNTEVTRQVKSLWRALLILQPFRPLHLRHSSFSNPSVALPTSGFIL